MPDAPTLEPIDESVFEPRPEDKLLKTPRGYLVAGLLVDGLILCCALLVILSYVKSFDQYYRGECGGLMGNSRYCTLDEYRRHNAMLIGLLASPLSLLLILPPLIGYFVGKRKKRKEAASQFV